MKNTHNDVDLALCPVAWLHTAGSCLYLHEAESVQLPAVCAGLHAVRTGVAQVLLQVSPLQDRPAAWVGALHQLILTRPQVLL